MKKLFIYMLVAMISLVLWTSSQAGVPKLAQAGMPFLKLDVGGRTAAMGGVAAATANDASAMFSNPAGMASVQGLDLILSQTNWIADIKHYGLATCYGLGKWGTFGVSAIFMDYGSFKETRPYEGTDLSMMDVGYEYLGDFQVGEYAVGVSYSRQISNQFSVGAQIKYVKQDLHESLMWHEYWQKEIVVKNDQALTAFDFGTLYYTGWKDLRIAMSLRNFSGQGRYVRQRFELPLTMNIGVAMDVLPLIVADNNSKLTLGLDASHPRDFSERVHFGAEYSFADMLFIRGGYKFNYDTEGLTAGLGLGKAFGSYGLRIDYAYGDIGEFFGAVHRLTWGISYK